jgi:hypothetical protein
MPRSRSRLPKGNAQLLDVLLRCTGLLLLHFEKPYERSEFFDGQTSG